MHPSDTPTPDDCTDVGDVDCDALFAELDLLLDGELAVDRLAELEGHIAACFPCAGRRDFEAQLRAVVRARCTDHAPPALVERIRTALELPSG